MPTQCWMTELRIYWGFLVWVCGIEGGFFLWIRICDDDFIYVLVIHWYIHSPIGNMMKTDEIIYLFLHSVFQNPVLLLFVCVFVGDFFFIFTLGLCIWGKNIFMLPENSKKKWRYIEYYVVKYPFVICFLVYTYSYTLYR